MTAMKPDGIEVKKDILIEAPEPHYSVDLHGLAYAARERNELIASKRIVRGFGGHANWRKWPVKYCRVRSPDNGRTWREETPYQDMGTMDTGFTSIINPFLDPEQNVLLGISFIREPLKGLTPNGFYGNTRALSFYQISRDGGHNWTDKKQVICRGCTPDQWMPGIEVGPVNALVVGPMLKLKDGSILVGGVVFPVGSQMKVAFVRGAWNKAKDGLEWEPSETLEVPEEVTGHGLCEPDLVAADGRLITTMRCQGSFEKKIISTRQIAVSEDNGLTWSKPRKLMYDDGTDVFVPASYACFVRLGGKIFWIANILDRPVCGQLPRYPLAIAEFDPDKRCIIRDSVFIIQDLPEGAPAGDDKKVGGRWYTNFSHYIDRETGELILIMGEIPKVDWDDYTSDCVRFRIKVKT